MTYKGRYKPKNPQKYIGDPDNIIYRSSWELRCMKYFDMNENVLKWSSEELVIPYISVVDKKRHRYFPDFVIQVLDENKKKKTIVVEVKPYKQTIPPVKRKSVTKRYIREVKEWGINNSKWQAAEEYCADRKWEFKILTEKELGI